MPPPLAADAAHDLPLPVRLDGLCPFRSSLQVHVSRIRPAQLSLLECVAAGRSGAVSVAELRRPSHPPVYAVVKVLDGAAGTSVESFLFEAERLCRLSHANVVACLGAVFDARSQAVVLELVGGGTLVEHLRADQPTSRLVRIAVELAAALEHIHSIIPFHGALCAGNVLVTPTGTCKAGGSTRSAAVTRAGVRLLRAPLCPRARAVAGAGGVGRGRRELVVVRLLGVGCRAARGLPPRRRAGAGGRGGGWPGGAGAARRAVGARHHVSAGHVQPDGAHVAPAAVAPV